MTERNTIGLPGELITNFCRHAILKKLAVAYASDDRDLAIYALQHPMLQ